MRRVSPPARTGVLDGMAARGVAILVFFACAGTLAYIHRDDLFPDAPPVAAQADDPFARCFAKRSADIASMQKEGAIKLAQAALFRTRAEAMCRDQARKAEGRRDPSLPTVR